MKIGPYEVVQPIGRGGMAVVYKARDPELERYVAIKELAAHLRNDEQAMGAFRQEAKLLAQLANPNVVSIYNVVQENGHCYLVMEFVEGQTLADLIKQGPIAPQTAVRILQDILAGLDAIHKAGILHRDLKPGNILLDRDGKAKISDFGIAERAEDQGRPMDFLSVKYMAPELYKPSEARESTAIDPRADIYALGIITYEMLLGDKGFRAEFQNIYPTESEIKKGEVAKKWMNWQLDLQQRFRPLIEVNEKIPRTLSDIVDRMTAKDFHLRYPEVGAILSDLKSWRSMEHLETEEDADPDRTIRATTLKPGAKPSPPKQPLKPSASDRPKSRMWMYVGGSVSVLVFLVLLFLPKSSVEFKFVSLPGADVKVDEYKPLRIHEDGTLTGKILPGKHHVIFSYDQYEPFEITVEVPPKQKWELKADLHKLAPPTPPPPPALIKTPTGNMVLVPGGEFIYGSQGRKTTLPAFYIDETEVTNSAYRKFCDQAGHPYPEKPPWDAQYFDKPQYPVVNVSWDDAVAYAQWAGKRLPTELEWEKAARGTDGRLWPWGNSFDSARANLEGEQDGYLYAAPVGSFPSGKSPYGALDMAGNVWEWVADGYDPATGSAVNLGKNKRMKGGAFLPKISAALSRTFISGNRKQTERPSGVGFRCAKDFAAAMAQPKGP
ncbi:MAG TPA: bifunctional serine/threonine-protein kinase/formylglycine-generating enzyme family protein [Candidatus Angelobacter sp.]|jgi:serine/threonine protein kinase|nr:bifunctional serine/threonine-protein kinase/formylglycine-generating enzyme family protein [Candidatus Angelobacter sp.]